MRCFARDGRPALIALVDASRLRRVLERMLDESEFLSPWGLRSLSRYHLERPLVVPLDGVEPRLDYAPAASRSGLFGGNSNWRGPVWSLGAVADEIERRLVRLFLRDGAGRRPIYGDCALFQADPAWHDQLLFHEHFDGDTGEGLVASHQTGWVALVGALIADRRRRSSAAAPGVEARHTSPPAGESPTE